MKYWMKLKYLVLLLSLMLASSCNLFENSFIVARGVQSPDCVLTNSCSDDEPSADDPSADFDGDGVFDDKDMCVWSVKAEQVDSNGCDVNMAAHNDSIEMFIDEKIEYQNKDAVFINIINALYEIDIDVNNRSVLVRSYLKFKVYEEGYPIFDSVQAISKAQLNKEDVDIGTASPGGVTEVKHVQKSVKPGKVHTLMLENSIPQSGNIQFSNTKVQAIFQMSDLSDRSFLEYYMPSNLQYDQIKMDFLVTVSGTSQRHKIIANGDIEEKSNLQWKVDFRSFYNASSVFFHLFPDDGTYDEATDNYTSINGKSIYLHAYSSSQNVNTVIQRIRDNLDEFETIYGAWEHPFMIALVEGSGGMEYAGATRTSVGALRHEMHHCYFARSIQPGRGNSGWLDEALASWGDSNFPTASTFPDAGMAGHSPYRRSTDTRAYSRGAEIMAYLNGQLSSQGGLNAFLKEFYAKYKEKIMDTASFQAEIEQFANKDFTNVFNPVFSIQNISNIDMSDEAHKACPHQQPLS